MNTLLNSPNGAEVCHPPAQEDILNNLRSRTENIAPIIWEMFQQCQSDKKKPLPVFLVNEAELSAISGLAKKSLSQWRWRGTPAIPYHKIGGKVLYNLFEVLDFLDSQRHTCTSTYGQQQAGGAQ